MFSFPCIIGVVFLFLYQQSAGQPTTPFFRSDYKYLVETQSFYKFHTRQTNWEDAKESCELEGAMLYYPETESENDVVVNYWNNFDNIHLNIYIGVSDTFVARLFETVDGKRTQDVYMSWKEGEPNNIQEHCVEMQADGNMNDVSCTLQFPFICKKKIESLEWNEQCNLQDRSYIYNKTTNKCYKIHVTPKDWTDAYRVCSEEQSYLAIIDDQKEAEHLSWLTSLSARAIGNCEENDEFLHVGYYNKDSKGWRTLKNVPLENMTYLNKLDSPCENKSKTCGAFGKDGQLHVIDCNTKYVFVCEHDVSHVAFISEFSSTTSTTEENYNINFFNQDKD